MVPPKSLLLNRQRFLVTGFGFSIFVLGHDRDEEARAEASEVLRIDSKFSVDYLIKQVPYKYDVDRKRLRASLKKAGLK